MSTGMKHTWTTTSRQQTYTSSLRRVWRGSLLSLGEAPSFCQADERHETDTHKIIY